MQPIPNPIKFISSVSHDRPTDRSSAWQISFTTHDRPLSVRKTLNLNHHHDQQTQTHIFAVPLGRSNANKTRLFHRAAKKKFHSFLKITFCRHFSTSAKIDTHSLPPTPPQFLRLPWPPTHFASTPWSRFHSLFFFFLRSMAIACEGGVLFLNAKFASVNEDVANGSRHLVTVVLGCQNLHFGSFCVKTWFFRYFENSSKHLFEFNITKNVKIIETKVTFYELLMYK